MSKLAIASKYYNPVISSRHRYLVLMGGRSSAKSHTAAQKMALLCRSEPNFKGVCVRQVYNTIKDSQFSKIETAINGMGLRSEFHIIKSPLEITHIPSGNKILARGLDSPEKLKSLDDPTVIWIEEALEISEDAFVKIDTSIRSPHETLKQAILTFNPEDEAHWLNDRFFPPKGTYELDDGSHTFIKSHEPDTCIMHSNFSHNDFLNESDKSTIKRLERVYGKESNYYRVYVLGLWGNALKGLVFEDVNYADEFPDIEHCKKFGYGLDFGFTNDPTAIVKCALAHGELWFQELVYETGLVNVDKEGTDPSICERLEFHDVGNTEIVADSAEPKSIREISNQGFYVKGVTKGKDSIEGGITIMKQYKINIVGASPNLRKETKSYKYQEAKPGMQVEFTNKPIDAWNHAIDAARYWSMHNLTKAEFFFC